MSDTLLSPAAVNALHARQNRLFALRAIAAKNMGTQVPSNSNEQKRFQPVEEQQTVIQGPWHCEERAA